MAASSGVLREMREYQRCDMVGILIDEEVARALYDLERIRTAHEVDRELRRLAPDRRIFGAHAYVVGTWTGATAGSAIALARYQLMAPSIAPGCSIVRM